MLSYCHVLHDRKKYRLKVSSSENQPEFIGLGVRKSGTSWLYACLEEHHEVFLPQKEVHFFSKDQLFDKGVDWYFELFSRRMVVNVCGEFSTTYFASDLAIRRIKNTCPASKLIVCLREPKKRAASHLFNDLLSGHIKWSDLKHHGIQIDEDSRYFKESIYGPTVKLLLNLFPRTQVHFVLYESIQTNPELVVRELYEFLGVDSGFKPSCLGLQINKSYVPRSSWLHLATDKLANSLRVIGLTKAIHFLRSVGIAHFVRSLNQKSVSSSDIAINFTSKCLSQFEKDRKAVQKLLNRDLKCWKN